MKRPDVKYFFYELMSRKPPETAITAEKTVLAFAVTQELNDVATLLKTLCI